MRLLVIARVSCVVWLLSQLIAAAPAVAQGVMDMGSGMGDEEAKAHFKVGSALYQSGRFAEAAAEWEKAYALSHKEQLLYNLYVAYRDASDLPNAISALRRYLESAQLEPEARVNLQARLRAMEEANSRAPSATAPAAAPSTPEPSAAAAPVPAPVAAAPAPASTEPAQNPHEASAGRPTVAYVLAIGGGALLAGGLVTALVANHKITTIKEDCSEDVCPADYGLNDKRDSARTWRTVSFALLGTGLVAGAIGAALLLTHGSEQPEPAATTAALDCGASGCMGSVRGVF
jgi:tetratricopeptide (TPR) repeat protein